MPLYDYDEEFEDYTPRRGMFGRVGDFFRKLGRIMRIIAIYWIAPDHWLRWLCQQFC